MIKMDYFNKILKESIVIVIISSLIGVVSGTVLSINDEVLYAIPVILLILPSLNSLTGDISTILVSRLTTHLYIGNIPPKFQKSDRLTQDFIALLISLLLSLTFLIVLGYSIAFSTGIQIVNPFIISFIIAITILMLFGILFFSMFFASVYLFKRGKDPSNFLIPVVTSLADFLTPLFLILFIQIFI